MSQEQQDIADLKAWRKVTEPILKQIAEDTSKILRALANTEAERCNHQPCPAPALCAALDKRVRDIENAFLSFTSAGKGVGKTLAVIWSFVLGIPLSLAACVEIIKYIKP